MSGSATASWASTCLFQNPEIQSTTYDQFSSVFADPLQMLVRYDLANVDFSEQLRDADILAKERQTSTFHCASPYPSLSDNRAVYVSRQHRFRGIDSLPQRLGR